MKNTQRLKRIPYEYISWAIYLLGGITLLGTILDAFGNASSLAQNGNIFYLIMVLIIIGIATEIYLRRYGLKITNKDGSSFILRNGGAFFRIGLGGAIVFLLFVGLCQPKVTPSQINEEVANALKSLLKEKAYDQGDYYTNENQEYEIMKQKYIELQQRLMKYELTSEIEEKIAESLSEGKFGKAEILLKQLKAEENRHQNNHRRKAAEAAFQLGKLYDMTLEPEKAKLEYEEAIQLDSNEVSFLNSYGELLYRMGGYDNLVKESFSKALMIARDKYGAIDSIVATCLNNLGALYSREKNYDKAIPFLEEAMTISIATRGEDHPLTIEVIDNLSEVLAGAGNIEEALSKGNQALDLALSTYGEKNIYTAYIYNNLGSIFQQQGDFKTAYDYFKKSHLIRLKLLASNNPNLGFSFNNLGSNYFYRGQFDKAIEFFQSAVDIWTNIYGENHPEVANSLCNMGGSYLEIGNIQKAEEKIQKTLDNRENRFGRKDYRTAISIGHLGRVRVEQGRYEEAFQLFTEEKNIYESFEIANHPLNGINFMSLGRALAYKGELDLAEKYCQQASQILNSVYSFDHPALGKSYLYLSEVFQCKGDLIKAKEMKTVAINLFKKLYGPRQSWQANQLKKALIQL